MKWFLFYLIWVVQAWAAATAPQSPQPPRAAATPAAEERYLFIVDVSAPMRGLDRESRQAIFDLVYWGIDGHMQPGDTFGIWLVDDELHAGDFPMQVWKAEQQLDLATKASLYIKEQRYRKPANYGKLSISLMALVMEIKDVNLFLVTDGKEPLVGFPLDEQLRQACAMRAKERQAKDKPFVIYLSARDGQIQSVTVAIAGEAIKMPPRSGSPRSTRSRSVAAADPGTKKPVGRVISLGYVDPEGLDDQKGLAADAESAVEGESSAAAPQPRSAEAEAVVRNERDQTAAIPANEAVAVVKAELNRAAAIPGREAAVVVKSETAQAVAGGSGGTVRTQTSSGLAPESGAGIAPPAASQPAEQPAVIPARTGEALTVAARELPAPPMAAAAPLPAEPLLSARELFVVSGVLCLVAIGLVISFFRRLPRAPQGSYISKSMDTEAKRRLVP